MNSYFSDTLGFFRSNWFQLAKISVPIIFIHQLSIMYGVDLSGFDASSSDEALIAQMQDLLPSLLLIELLFKPVLATVVASYVISAVDDNDYDEWAAVRRAFTFVPTVMLAYAVIYLISFVGLTLFIIPGLFLYFRFSLVAVAVVAKKQSLGAAMLDSWQVTGSYWKLLLIGYILLFAMVFLVSSVMSSFSQSPIFGVIIAMVTGVLALLVDIYRYRIFQLSLK